jgi:hypothetical protein
VNGSYKTFIPPWRSCCIRPTNDNVPLVSVVFVVCMGGPPGKGRSIRSGRFFDEYVGGFVADITNSAWMQADWTQFRFCGSDLSFPVLSFLCSFCCIIFFIVIIYSMQSERPIQLPPTESIWLESVSAWPVPQRILLKNYLFNYSLGAPLADKARFLSISASRLSVHVALSPSLGLHIQHNVFQTSIRC